LFETAQTDVTLDNSKKSKMFPVNIHDDYSRAATIQAAHAVRQGAFNF